MAAKENHLPEPDECEKLILDTIKRIKKDRKRADSKLICSMLGKSMGLNQETVMLQITMLMATGKIVNASKNDQESLKINESIVIPGLTETAEGQCTEKEKTRKLSSDENKMIRCRNELIEVADKTLPVTDNKNNKKNPIVQDADVEIIEPVVNFPETTKLVNSEKAEQRLKLIENEMKEVINRLKAMEAKHSDPIVYQELNWRIWKLERENKILKEENLSLKFINSEFREALEMRTTKNVNPWLTPKEPSRAKVPEQTQISLNNRFQGLQAPEKEITNSLTSKSHQTLNFPEEHYLKDTRPKGNLVTQNRYRGLVMQNRYSPLMIDDPQPQRNTVRNPVVVPGERSYKDVLTQSNGSNEKNFKQDQENTHDGNEYHPRDRKPWVVIVGDSIVGSIQRKDLKEKTRNHFVTTKTFKGATTEDMKSYITPSIDKQPHGMILHFGTNNLKKDNPETIAASILNTAMKARSKISNVAVSCILARGDTDEMDDKRNRVN
eukprot:gene21157-23237_t